MCTINMYVMNTTGVRRRTKGFRDIVLRPFRYTGLGPRPRTKICVILPGVLHAD